MTEHRLHLTDLFLYSLPLGFQALQRSIEQFEIRYRRFASRHLFTLTTPYHKITYCDAGFSDSQMIVTGPSFTS